MNKDKIIKDLKERNDKLKNQYQLQEIRLHSLEYEKEKLQKELDYADNYNIYLIAKLDKIKEYIKENTRYYDKELGLVEMMGAGETRTPVVYLYGLLELLEEIE